jgi:membrane protein DedA with SNARE-associated domain
MTDRAEALLDWLVGIPDVYVYLLLSVAAAVENVIPPIPADVMVLIGGVIAGAGGVDPVWLFLVVWAGNVGSALAVYELGKHYGSSFFDGRIGRLLLAPRQLVLLNRAYQRFGFPIVFVSRFLPVFRPVVPVFAGVSGLGFLATALPVMLASAIWYGFLVYLGTVAGENWRAILDAMSRAGTWLWVVAGVLLLLFGVWWRRTRREPEGTGAEV